MTEITFSVELLAAIGVFITPITILAVRFWIKREKCFTVLEQKVDNLSNHDEGAHDTHTDLYEKVNRIERNLFHLMGVMKITPVD